MNQNQFHAYDQLRSYQLHCQRLQSKTTRVPNHIAYHPTLPNLNNAKNYHRNQMTNQVEKGNKLMLDKLVTINTRKNTIQTQSSPNLILPPIKQKKFTLPTYSEENGIMAKKIIGSKPSVRTSQQIKQYKSLEGHRRRISRYQSGMPRKAYLANMLMLKKLKGSRVINPEFE